VVAQTPDQAPGPGTITRRELVSALAAVAGMGTISPDTAAATARVKELPIPVEVVPLPPQASVTEGFVDAAGARLWYWDTGGKGEPVVLLHPATGSGATWGYQQPVLAKARYRVVGYSRRGHFRSVTTDASAAYTDLEDLRALISNLGLSRFHLIGSAAGAFLAAQYAVTYPQQLASVVLSSSLISIQDKEYQDLIARVVPSSFAMMPPDFRELGPSYRTANPEGTAQWVALEKAARAAGPYPPRPTSVDPSIVTFEKLGALKVPMLLLTGTCDLYACPALLVYVARRLGRNEVAVIDNAGHAAFWEQPEAYNRAVLGFMEQYRFQPP
jgi:pimeloyl-ACP methyl ester carboxylesterase